MIRNLSDHKSDLARPISESKTAFEKPGFLLPNRQTLGDHRLSIQEAFSWFSIAHPELTADTIAYAQKRLQSSSLTEKEFFLAQASLQIITEARTAELWVPPDFAQNLINKDSPDQTMLDFISQFNQKTESEIYLIVNKQNKPKSLLRKRKNSSFITYTYYEPTGDWVIGFDYLTKSSLSMLAPVNVDEFEPELRSLLSELGFKGGQTLRIYDYADGIGFKNILKSNKQIDIFI